MRRILNTKKKKKRIKEWKMNKQGKKKIFQQVASFSSYTGKTRTFADFMIFSSLPAARKGRTASNTFTQHLLHLKKNNKRKSDNSGVGAAPRGERSRLPPAGGVEARRSREVAPPVRGCCRLLAGPPPLRLRGNLGYAGLQLRSGLDSTQTGGTGTSWAVLAAGADPHPGDTGGILCCTQEGRSRKAKASVRPGAVIQHVYKQKPHVCTEILTCLSLTTYFLTCCLEPAAFSQARISPRCCYAGSFSLSQSPKSGLCLFHLLKTHLLPSSLLPSRA